LEASTKKGKAKAKLTPLMKQYFEVKQKHPDALLLFRVGDFYETFGEDAVKASRILGIILTSRNNGGSDIELAGFPHHSVEVYLPKLVQAGYRVAICEQMEKPSKEKKIVRRDVTEVVTPGVTVNDSILNAGQNNFLCGIVFEGQRIGLAFVDISTGEFLVHEGERNSASKIFQSFKSSEVIFSKASKDKVHAFIDNSRLYTHALDEWFFEQDYTRELLLKHFDVHSLKGFGIESMGAAQLAAGAVLHYLSTVQQGSLSHIHRIERVESDEFMWLDKFTIRNLELVQSNHESGKSLLDVIDRTETPMGTRMLYRWLLLPLKSCTDIIRRQDCVESLLDDEATAANLTGELKTIGDLERLSSKLSLRKINPKEFAAIKNALDNIRNLSEFLKGRAEFSDLEQRLDPCQVLYQRIKDTLHPEAPAKLNAGQVIKTGWNEKLDEWRSVSSNSKEILLELQVKESKRTGIANLKVGFNNVFGYYFEVTNKYKGMDLIPEDWIRKQTLKGSERYINEELKEVESRILQAEERIAELEESLYEELLDAATQHIPALLKNAAAVAELDCYLSFARLAKENDYNKPEIDDSFTLDIRDGRHPVIESQLPAESPYVPNDVMLDLEQQQIIMITGPNMSGKSAVLRQTALITLLAHIGSYVPASKARIGVIDKIFTRVGASDNISSGESTFMVEMNETSSILNNLSDRSLIILDEIGRGTSTYDGISIAWAIAEYLHNGPCPHPKTLFATHYHELSELEDRFDRIKNYNVSTKEYDGKVIFLRKLVKGACASSFGIHVAQMSGMPKEIIDNASRILNTLESQTIDEEGSTRQKLEAVTPSSQLQMNLFQMDDPAMKEIRNQLASIDITAMTPIEALIKLKELQDNIKE